MTRHRDVDDARLDLFLDGLLPAAQAAELRAASDGAAWFGKAVEAQRMADAALRRLFPAPAAPQDLLRALELRRSRPPLDDLVRRPTAKRAWLAVAAMIAVSLTAWLNWERVFPAKSTYTGELKPWRDVASVYHDTIRDGFKPEWVCKDDAEFQRAVANRLGQPLLFAQVPGLTAVGWTYANTITPRTMGLLVTAQTSPATPELKPDDAVKIIVYLDRAGVGKQPAAPADGHLHLFSRTLGKLTAFELTPLPRPVALDQLYIP